jgi:hypothetical protein
MLDTLFSSSLGETLSLGNTLIIITSALVLGLIISLTYMYTHREEGYAPSIPVTIIMLPAIISIIILLVGNSIARAFSLAGAFSLIRFRSAPGDPKDIAYVFFTLAVGLSCGIGYIGYASLFTAVMCLVMVVIMKTSFGRPKHDAMILKVTIPENLNFQGLFDDILKEYTASYHMKRIKSTDLGSLFEISYYLQLKQGADQKALMDALRCRNGNLNISLVHREFEEKVYS